MRKQLFRMSVALLGVALAAGSSPRVAIARGPCPTTLWAPGVGSCGLINDHWGCERCVYECDPGGEVEYNMCGN